MKIRLTFAIALFVCFTFNLQAQLRVGADLGYTRAWQDYGAFQAPEGAQIHVHGFHASLTAYKSLNRYFAIGVEPGFIERGAACVPGWQPVFEGDTRLDLHYIQVPAFLECRLPLIENHLELIGGLGYSLGFMAAAFREDAFFLIDTPPTRTRLDDSNGLNDLNRWDHGAQGKLGLALRIGSGQLLLQSSYYHGLRNADRNNDSQNRGLNFSIGWRTWLQER